MKRTTLEVVRTIAAVCAVVLTILSIVIQVIILVKSGEIFEVVDN